MQTSDGDGKRGEEGFDVRRDSRILNPKPSTLFKDRDTPESGPTTRLDS